MGFAAEGDIMKRIEKILQKLWKKMLNIDLELPIKKMSYEKAMRNYGSDKPDLRFDMKVCTKRC